jgi:hypothetical protein
MLLDFSNVNVIAFYLTLIMVIGFVISMVLLLRSGRGHSAEEVEANSIEFPGGLREGHGGMPLFLSVFFGIILIWTIVYFVIHASEFAVIFAP